MSSQSSITANSINQQSSLIACTRPTPRRTRCAHSSDKTHDVEVVSFCSRIAYTIYHMKTLSILCLKY